jgi:hypothetical protein
MSISFWPSTIATRSSSCCVALNNIRFIFINSATRGPIHAALARSGENTGMYAGGECWRWYARGVARQGRPQGANGIERHCRAHAATLIGRRGPVRAAQGHWAGAKATTARPRAGLSGLRESSRQKPAGTNPGALQRVRRKRQALSTPSPGEPTLRPACRYLSLRFQTVQSCNPVHYPITTAVQPWCEQECAYTFISIEFALLRGRWRRPCVKYRFNSYTCRGLTAACRLYIQNEGLREKFCPACNNRRR